MTAVSRGGETTSLLSMKVRKFSLTKASRGSLMTYSKSFSFSDLLRKTDTSAATGACMELKDMVALPETSHCTSSSDNTSCEDSSSSSDDSLCSCSQAESLLRETGEGEEEEAVVKT